MEKIKIAQIGTSKNSHGISVWTSMKKQSDIFEIVGYAMPENEKEKFADQMVSFEDYREMTVDEILSNPEIEAVTVETEEIYLTKYATLVAKAGKHIHMEKPGGTNLSEFEELINIIKSKNLAFTLGYMYRFNPMIKKAIRDVKNGKLGKIFSVEAQMNCLHAKETKEWMKNFPGGMIFFLGCHLIDLIYQIQGEPEHIIPLSCSTHTDGINTKDYGMAVFKYPNGLSFAKTCSSEHGGFLRRQLVISGEKGTIEINPLEVLTSDGQYTVMNENFTDDWFEPWKKSQSELFDRYDNMMKNFAEIVRGKENPYGYDYELNLYKLILKACGEEM